jgi:hypothetical protein
MSRSLAIVAVVALIVVGGSAISRADRADWVGSDACGSCHPAELAAWKQTAHAGAADRLGTKPKSRCLACHGTGDAPAGKASFCEVGCEACHGSGADYAADDIMRDRPMARALGLRDLSTAEAVAAMCAGCHRGTGTRLEPPPLTVSPTTVH